MRMVVETEETIKKADGARFHPGIYLSSPHNGVACARQFFVGGRHRTVHDT